MNRLIQIITSDDDNIRDQSLDSVCDGASLDELLKHAAQLDQFRRTEENLYHRVRALFFLAAIYRYIWLRSGGADPRDLPITVPTALSANAAAAAGAGGVRVR